MKLALLGYPISHSQSPDLYKKFLGDQLESYELLEIENSIDVPTISELASRFDGLSITSPHKKLFFGEVIVPSPIVRELKAINTISFTRSGVHGTNTDVTAVETILLRMKTQKKNLELIILGDGVMSRVTILVARSLQIPFEQYSRKKGDDITHLNLGDQRANPTVVINTCTRDFIFKGQLHPELIFWDYNYSFLPHQNTLPSRVKEYRDGMEMLRLQALAAIEFWSAT
jgi:shikimate dehydrogenase